MCVISLDMGEVVEYKELNNPVLIVWDDHTSFTENLWRDFDTLKELSPMEVKTLGYIIKDERDYYVLAAHITDSNVAMGELCIMKANIKEFNYLSPLYRDI